MPDTERQIWEIRSSKRCRAHPIEKIEVSKRKKNVENKELREMDNQKRDERRDNEKWSFM